MGPQSSWWRDLGQTLLPQRKAIYLPLFILSNSDSGLIKHLRSYAAQASIIPPALILHGHILAPQNDGRLVNYSCVN